MSNNNIFTSFIDNNYTSSIHRINEYKNKYSYNKNNSNILKNKYNFNNTIKLNINNETAKYIAMNNINNYEKNLLIKVKKNEKKNKIYIFKDLKNNNVYLQTEREIFNDPKPQPFPIKINKNNKIDYNSIMTNIFSNQLKKNNMNKNNTMIGFYNTKNFNDLEIEENCDSSSYIKPNQLINISNRKNNNKIYNNSLANINYNRRIENQKNNYEKELNKEKDMKLIFVLKNLELENLINIFNTHSIKFRDLFQLSKYDLLEMNIPIGPRNRIITFIKDYKNFAKKYDLNELNKFFKTNLKNGIFINAHSLKTNNELKISFSENNINEENNCTNNINNKDKDNNKYNSFCRNLSNISIFNNYYENNFKNGKKRKKYSLYTNELTKENDIYKKENMNIIYNKYNSMSNLINYNNINQISQINKRNKNNKKKTNGNYFTLYNDKNINHNINYISSENCIKKLFCKSNSFKSQNLNFRKKYTLNNNHLNYKISQKRKKFIKKFSNINDEVKIFENHLKVMRKKSQETNSRVETLLNRRRNLTYFENTKINGNEKDNHHKKNNNNMVNNHLQSSRNNSTKITNNKYDKEKRKNIHIFYWNNKN